jgi:hypothetical protein
MSRKKGGNGGGGNNGGTKVVNIQNIQQSIRNAYEAYRKDNKDSLPEFKWGDVEEAALKLVSEHSEQVLRCASSMAGVYQRKLRKDGAGGVDKVLRIGHDVHGHDVSAGADEDNGTPPPSGTPPQIA